MRSLPWLLAASAAISACARSDREQAAITVDTLTIFGDAEGAGALAFAPRSVAVDSRGRYWATHNGISIFSGDGEFLHAFVATGSGPREFASPASATQLPGDSVLILDPRNRRATI